MRARTDATIHGVTSETPLADVTLCTNSAASGAFLALSSDDGNEKPRENAGSSVPRRRNPISDTGTFKLFDEVENHEERQVVARVEEVGVRLIVIGARSTEYARPRD